MLLLHPFAYIRMIFHRFANAIQTTQGFCVHDLLSLHPNSNFTFSMPINICVLTQLEDENFYQILTCREKYQWQI